MHALNTKPLTPWALRAMKFLHIICDICATGLSFWLVMRFAVGVPSSAQSINLGFIALIIGLTYLAVARSHYSTRRPYWTEFSELSVTCFWMASAHISLMVVMNNPLTSSQLILAWAVTYLALLLSRAGFRSFRRLTNTWFLPYVLVGDGDNASAAEAALASEPLLGYRCSAALAPEELSNTSMPELVARYAGATWVLALESTAHDELQRLVNLLDLNANDFIVIPPTRGLPLFSLKPIHVFSQDLLLLRGQNRLSQLPALLFKRTIDVFGSVVLLILLSPILLAVALLVRRDTGRILFWHSRMGYGGKAFMCPKFRSMRPDAHTYLHDLLANDVDLRNEWEAQFKLRNDPRVTALGKWLRALSIDELPQLWSVLRGDMSLIGPRPVTEDELVKYGSSARYYTQVRPGITGLWQVSGRSETDYATRVSLDTWYVKNWTFGLDVIIFLKTWSVIIRRKGAW